MKSDPATDLDLFLAYSLELEQESAERLREFAAIMQGHHRAELAATFELLAHYSDKHVEEVKAICGDRELPQVLAWEFDWPENEAPETCQYDSLDYAMSTREALLAMLAQERGTAAFYQGVADRSEDAAIRAHALEFAEEERNHASSLEAWLERLDDDDGAPPDIDEPRVID